MVLSYIKEVSTVAGKTHITTIYNHMYHYEILDIFGMEVPQHILINYEINQNHNSQVVITQHNDDNTFRFKVFFGFTNVLDVIYDNEHECDMFHKLIIYEISRDGEDLENEL